MDQLRDLISIIGQCMTMFADKQPLWFGVTIVVGVILAGLCWWGATHYSRLFNLEFRITKLHQVLCALAGLLTLSFTVVYASLGYSRDYALQSIDSWSDRTKADHAFRANTYRKSYYAVKALNVEDFSKFPPPGQPGSRIPTSSQKARETTSTIEAGEIRDSFSRVHPFIGKVIWPDRNAPIRMALADQNQWFGSGNRTYPVERAMTLITNHMRQNLTTQLPRVVRTARLLAVIVFLLAQAIPFLWIGIAAYRDLKLRT